MRLSRLFRHRTPDYLVSVVRPRHHRMACVLYTVDPHTGAARFELAGRGDAGQLVRSPGCGVVYATEGQGVRVQWTLGLIPVRVDRAQAMRPTLAEAA